ncbi:MAG: type II toxin-antitoxin system HicB family antitoxin [Thiotrichaceae bacterium]|nr:type II toxin-antitoxin system HicB family antitoxin [Thiotrichaceae bacterium]
MNILKYKEYEGTVEVDMDRLVCRGKILFIDDLVTYVASSLDTIQAEFEAAVDDYIETCKSLGKKPHKSLKGQFNVRIPPEAHKLACKRAITDDVSLNDVVVKALDSYLNVNADINHNVTLTINIPSDNLKTFVSSGSDQTIWESELVQH